MAFCDISGGIAAALDGCNLNLIAGVEDRLLLFNYSERGAIVKDGSNPLLITSISLAGAAVAYQFDGLNSSIKPSTTLVVKTYQKSQTHAVNFLVFSHEVADEKIIQDLLNGTLCALVKTKTGHWKLYGYNSGLQAVEGSQAHEDADLNGAWQINIASKEGDEEPEIPYTVFDTDEATTEAMIVGLLTP